MKLKILIFLMFFLLILIEIADARFSGLVKNARQLSKLGKGRGGKSSGGGSSGKGAGGSCGGSRMGDKAAAMVQFYSKSRYKKKDSQKKFKKLIKKNREVKLPVKSQEEWHLLLLVQ
jgi:hypothetical protein